MKRERTYLVPQRGVAEAYAIGNLRSAGFLVEVIPEPKSEPVRHVWLAAKARRERRRAA